MTSSIHLFLLIALLFNFGCARQAAGETHQETAQEAIQKIAQAAGIDAFGSIESISYTFNAELGERTFLRAWTWRPKTDEVTLQGETDALDVQYQRAQIASGSADTLTDLDKKFINDLYWLMFPFQVVWDSTVSVESLSPEAAAVVPEAFAGLRVRYPEGVGYTPGDIYDLFYDKDYQVTHWVFRKGGSAEPTRITDWTNYENFGPLSLSLTRDAPDSSLRLWFENVSVELAD
jgi:hypothetical protein